MTSTTSSSTFSKLASLGAWLAFAAACGGRVSTDSNTSSGGTSDPGGNTTTTTGGDTTTTGMATTGTTTGYMGDTGGSSNAGGSTNTGTAGDFTGSGGAVGAGGSVTMCTGACDNVACPPGTSSFMYPGACCPTCVPCTVACKACPKGTHSQPVPNQCCGTCVVDPQQTCESGRMGYEAFRSQLLDKFGSAGCKTDEYCQIASEINRCAVRCGVALPSVTADDWKSTTISYGDANCSNCPPLPLPACPEFQARCVMGKCILGAPTP